VAFGATVVAVVALAGVVVLASAQLPFALSGAASLERAAGAPDAPDAGLRDPAGGVASRPPAAVPVPAPVPAPQGEPTRVLIPAIEVDVALVRLGLRVDRAMEVPEFGSAGWYSEGPMPGHPGPAVLAGHVDSWSGPDVFFRLSGLVAGDVVHVDYDSGDRVTFVVEWSERTPKDALPAASIWPVTTDRLLTLITCGGTFDRSAGSYRDNVIVYATPLVSGPSGPSGDATSGQR
jgi:sortase (surface protein transpeptidase)